MQGWLDSLNRNAGALSVVFGAVVMMSTVVYARLTAALVRETTRMRQAQSDPEVVVRLQPSEAWMSLIELVVENNGMGTAYDLKLEATTDLEYAPGKRLSELGLFKHGLRTLGPRQGMKTFLMSVAGKVDQIETSNALQFAVTARYRTAFNATVERRFDLDLRFLLGLVEVGVPPLKKIAEAVEAIQKEVKHLSSGFHRLKVIAYTKADIDKENAELAEYAKRMQQKKASAVEPGDKTDRTS